MPRFDHNWRIDASGHGHHTSRKPLPSTFPRNSNTSPPAWQPKHLKRFVSGKTLKPAVFSLWKGQRPAQRARRACRSRRRRRFGRGSRRSTIRESRATPDPRVVGRVSLILPGAGRGRSTCRIERTRQDCYLGRLALLLENRNKALPRSTRRLTRPTHRPQETPLRNLLDVRQVHARLKNPARTAFAVGVFAGLRTREFLDLDWKDVDLEARQNRVRQAVRFSKLGPLKDEDPRTVPVLDALAPARPLEALHWRNGAALQAETGELCPNTLHDRLIAGFCDPERCLTLRVADTAITAEALPEHAQQHRDVAVDVVEDANLLLRGVETMEPARVLDQRPLPRNRQREEERVEPGVVEALTT